MDSNALLPIVAEWLQYDNLPAFTPRSPHHSAHPLKQTNIVAVIGPRRAGKTYYLYQIIHDLLQTGVKREDILFVDFEDYRLKGFKPEDIDALFTACEQLCGRQPTYLFFDEIQHLPDWSRVLRTLHNRHRHKIIITGSNSSLLSSEVATELRGRYEDITLLPFSFAEYLAFAGIEWNQALLHTPKKGKIIKTFDAFLRGGGYPEVCAREIPMEKRRLLQNYYDTIFYRDVLERHHVRARAEMDQLMMALLNGAAEMFSISSFEKQLRQTGAAPSKRTIANYLLFLREAFFVIANEKFSYSARKRLANPRKTYLLDTGFGLLSTSFSENKGKWLENAIAIELRRRDRAMFYFKDRYECDFILMDGARPAEAWQVCWELTPHNEPRELNGLAAAMDQLKIKTGGILTFDQEGKRDCAGRKIPVAPVWKWLLGAEDAFHK